MIMNCGLIWEMQDCDGVPVAGLTWAQSDSRNKTALAATPAVFRKFRREESAVLRLRLCGLLAEDSGRFCDLLIPSPRLLKQDSPKCFGFATSFPMRDLQFTAADSCGGAGRRSAGPSAEDPRRAHIDSSNCTYRPVVVSLLQ